MGVLLRAPGACGAVWGLGGAVWRRAARTAGMLGEAAAPMGGAAPTARLASRNHSSRRRKAGAAAPNKTTSVRGNGRAMHVEKEIDETGGLSLDPSRCASCNQVITRSFPSTTRQQPPLRHSEVRRGGAGMQDGLAALGAAVAPPPSRAPDHRCRRRRARGRRRRTPPLADRSFSTCSRASSTPSTRRSL